METQTSQISNENQEEIKKREELVQYYEYLAFASASEQGLQIIREINSKKNDLQNQLFDSLNKYLGYPYKFSEEEQEGQKILRIKIEALSDVLSIFKKEDLLQISKQYRNEIELLKNNLPLENIY